MSQLSFLSIAQNKKKLKCEQFLNRMDQVVPWRKLAQIIKPYFPKAPTGRKRMDLETMLRILCLQQWFNLSDPGVEEAIYDRNSFQKFLKLDLLSSPVPDETTILKFRHSLEKHNLFKEIFIEINKYLEEKGLLMKAGTIVDATLIAAPGSTKNKAKKRDPEMSSTCKAGKWHFGMKAHIGVDASSGLVHSMSATTAKDHDITQIDNILHGDEKAIIADKGYADTKRKKLCRKKSIFWGVLDKAKRGQQLSSSQNKRNRKLAAVRGKVEHPFQIIKCQWKYTKVRYRGINKNLSQLYLLFGLSNLFKVRKTISFAH
jgi:IS5 family transposase